MKKRISLKRLASTFLAAAVVLSAVPAVFAADETAVPVMTPEQAKAADIPAFPGAEGGGKYTTGARGGEVYYVTNLNDDGEGSLRDAVSKPNRTVLFKVSGTIHLKSGLNITQPNITIAGQSAPGGGVCVADYNVVVAADNIIIRYMRFRPGGVTGAENDGFGGRYQKDIIVDHCSVSWSTDEALSLYSVANTTVQYCISSESLTLGAHAKGRHGYGGIWGGANVTYHHNLVATHTSRLPRYASKSSTHPDFKDINGNDMVNNVIYNWGFNNTYGAEEASVNMVNNYYKSGPITNADVKGRIFNPSNGGSFYISGNVVEGNAEVTADNMKGVFPDPKGAEPVYLTAPDYTNLMPMDNIDTAEEAYKKVLADVGATLPMRDSYDAKIIDDTEKGVGRSINDEDEVGGWPELASGEAPIDSDGDGIPDEWESKNGLDKNNSADGAAITGSGYSNLEIYLNSIVENAAQPQNPEVEISNIEENQLFDFGKPVEIKANAQAASGRTIEKVEFFVNDNKVGEDSSKPYSYTAADIPEGQHYLSARAVDSKGEATTSEIRVVNINYTDSTGEWTAKDIGDTTIPGSYAYKDGQYIVKSSGLIGAGNEFNVALGDSKTDAFSYLYQPIEQNGVISTKINEVSKLNNNCVTGLMIRQELIETSDFVLINYEHEKGGSGLSFTYRKNGEYVKEFIKLEVLPRYVKLIKEGGKVTGWHSENGIDWISFGEIDMPFTGGAYAGIAVDGNKETNEISTYTTGKFSDLILENYGANSIPHLTVETNGEYYRKGQTINVSVSSSENNELEKIDLYYDGEIIGTDSSLPFEFTIPADTEGNHFITAKAYDKDGASNSSTANVGVSSAPLMWRLGDVGNVKLNGGISVDGDKIKLYGSGFGVADTDKEQFTYAYMPIKGDFEVSFKIDEQQLSDYSHLGVVLRNGLEEGSASYAYYFQKYNGELLKMNSAKGEKYTQIAQQKYKKTPVWLKLQKTGNTIYTSYSKDGSEWTDVGSEETALNEKFYFGLFGATAEELLVSEFDISEFNLDFYATRADAAMMISDVLGAYDASAQCPFADVEADSVYYGYIAGGYNKGLLKGTSDVTFEPEAFVTREEAAVMLSRALGQTPSGSAASFSDYSEISPWAQGAVNALYSAGIVHGNTDGTFNPKGIMKISEIVILNENINRSYK